MLSIIVSWRDRKELEVALPSLMEAARLAGGDVTVVDYAGDGESLLRQVSGHRGSRLQLVKVVGERYFNKSRAQNVGASVAKQPCFFFCDCDIIVEPAQVAELASSVLSEDATFGTLAGVRESVSNARRAGNVACFGYELNLRLANGRKLRIVDNEEDAETGTRQAPGLLFVKREHFLAIAGYNGRLHGWGWEDQDIIARLTLALGLERRQAGTATHVSHDDDARIAHYPPVADRWESRDRMFRQALAYYDRADFAGTYHDDVATLKPRRIGP